MRLAFANRASCPRVHAPALQHLLCCLPFFIVLTGTPGNVHAFDSDVININLVGIERYDSNLFALPDSVSPANNGRRSATTLSTGADLRIDKPYGLQRFDLYASIFNVHYSPYSNLDSRSYTFGAAWAWTFTPELTGNLSINQSRQPNSFADTGFQTTANPRATQDTRFDANFRPGAAIHPRFSVLRTTDKSAQTTIERQNAETNSVEGAMVYDFRSGNSSEVYFRRGRGRYLDQGFGSTAAADTEFSEREIGIGARWRSSGASSFGGHVGRLTRTHPDFGQRNFAGTVAQLDYTYVATGKTQLQVTASRTLGASATTFSNYSQDETYAIRPTWAATGKITVQPAYALIRRDYRGSSTPGINRLETKQRDASVMVDWSVLRGLDLSFLLIHSTRSSSDPTLPFSNRGAQLSSTLHF